MSTAPKTITLPLTEAQAQATFQLIREANIKGDDAPLVAGILQVFAVTLARAQKPRTLAQGGFMPNSEQPMFLGQDGVRALPSKPDAAPADADEVAAGIL